MKIVFFMFGLVGGGAERVTSIIASGLAERGHDVTIMCKDVPCMYPISEKIRFKHFRPARRIKLRLFHMADMRNYIKKEKPDIAIGVLSFYSFYLRFATLGLPVKTIAWDHSSYSFDKIHGFKTYVRKYWVYPLMTKAFVLTQQDKNEAYFKNNIIVMPNPTTFESLSGEVKKEKIVIGVGNVNTWHTKGFDLLLQAWSKVIDKHKEWKLIIVGRGNSSYLDHLKEELKIQESVSIEPFCKDVKQLYQRASIFVLSSRTEGFSMVLLEAMSQKCACLACDNKGRTKEITNGDGLLLFETGCVDQMSEKIDELMSNEQLRKELGESAAIQSAKYSKDRILDKWEEILKSL